MEDGQSTWLAVRTTPQVLTSTNVPTDYKISTGDRVARAGGRGWWWWWIYTQLNLNFRQTIRNSLGINMFWVATLRTLSQRLYLPFKYCLLSVYAEPGTGHAVGSRTGKALHLRQCVLGREADITPANVLSETSH